MSQHCKRRILEMHTQIKQGQEALTNGQNKSSTDSVCKPERLAPLPIYHETSSMPKRSMPKHKSYGKIGEEKFKDD